MLKLLQSYLKDIFGYWMSLWQE